MKDILKLILFFTVVLFTACNSENRIVDKRDTIYGYEYHNEEIFTDSILKAKQDWITKTVSAASLQMTAGDYEDPEDLIEEVKEQADDLFNPIKREGILIRCSVIRPHQEDYITWNFLPSTEFTHQDSVLFKKLKREHYFK